VRYDRWKIIRRSVRQWLRVSALLLLFAGSVSVPALRAQTSGEEATPQASPSEESTSTQEKSVDPFSGLEVPGQEGQCPPPSTQEKILIGVGALALAVVLFLLLVRLMERRYIQKDRSATLGRHLGFSLTLVLSALGLLALVYLITGCLHPEFLLWLAFCGVVWVIHGAYTFIAVRGD
jgi:hypothetical protein